MMLKSDFISLPYVFFVAIAFMCFSTGLAWAESGLSPSPVYETASGQRFLENITDIPLMKDMVEMPDSAAIFDTAAGRIVESAAVGKGLDKRDIELFYNQTLPQLGWLQDNHGAFVREGERLYLEIEESDKYSIVFFRVEPVR
jgi:hypothetical protein